MSIRIRDLLMKRNVSTVPSGTPTHWVFEPDWLEEVTILGSTHVFLTSTVAMLIDLRTSPHFTDNTGVLLLTKVTHAAYTRRPPASRWVWTLSGSLFEIRHGRVSVGMSEMFGSRLEYEAAVAEFISGNVDNIEDIAAAIEDDDMSAYLRTTPDWDSLIEVTWSAQLP